jgi:Family of unknown function (DUF5906)
MNDVSGGGGHEPIHTLDDIPALRDYFARIGAKPRSLRMAVVEEENGVYWKDLVVIHVGRDGKIDAPEGYKPTDAEAALIAQQCSGIPWPELVRIETKNERIDLPHELKTWPKDQLFFFRGRDDRLIMIQQRKILANGKKVYLPWTHWSDDRWRRCEPEGPLPIWGMEQVGHHSIGLLHEGAKSAAFVAELVRNGGRMPDGTMHPWAEELAIGVHLGWIGGALNPARTDWEEINRLNFSKVIIVADNDDNGIKAIPKIAVHLRMPTYCICFSKRWPQSADLGDPFPEELFHTAANGKTYYIGPSFKQCLSSATWATDSFPIGKKTVYALRDSFIGQWVYVPNIDRYLAVDKPYRLYDENVTNKELSAFCHDGSNPAKLIAKCYEGPLVSLTYQPAMNEIVHTTGTNELAVNTHIPTSILAVDGDEGPWLEFMGYLIPEPIEMVQTLRWIATLLARLEVHMEYALLFISEQQGVGKTTLAARILAPLVGPSNVSYPTEEQILGQFNGSWQGGKRLVVIAEIYQGRSWKAYNKLKSAITDKNVDVEEKFMKAFTIENFAHVVASSNSYKALKLDDDDRRWFFPSVTTTPWPEKKFTEFYTWLEYEGGLGIILHWARHKWEPYWKRWKVDNKELAAKEGLTNRGAFVTAGEHAPMTVAKRLVIEQSRTDEQKELISLLEIVAADKAVVLFSKEVTEWLRHKFPGNGFHDTFHELKKAVLKALPGWDVHFERLRFGGAMQFVLLSPAMVRLLSVDPRWAVAKRLKDKELAVWAVGEGKATAVRCQKIIMEAQYHATPVSLEAF